MLDEAGRFIVHLLASHHDGRSLFFLVVVNNP